MTYSEDEIRSLVRALDASLHRGASWHRLDDAAKAWLIERLLDGRLTLDQMRREIADRAGAQISLSSLSKYAARARAALRAQQERRETRERVLDRILGARAVAEDFERLAGEVLPGVTQSLTAVLADRLLDALGKPDLSAEDIASLREPLRSLLDAIRTAQRDRELRLREDEITLAREKFELLRTQAEKAQAAEAEAKREELSPEQRIARIKEIFGIAA